MASLIEYTDAAMRQASYEKMEDGSWFASIPQFDGLWATGTTRDDARKELRETLPGWIEVHTKIGNRIPTLAASASPTD